MKCRVDKVEAEVHVHATEDRSKVIQALINVLGPVEYEVTLAQGHYGNPITVIRATATKGEECPDKTVVRLFSLLSELDRRLLMLTAEDRIEGGRLYLRLNKQAAYRGSMKLDDGGDVVRVIIYFNPGAAWGRSIKSLLGELVGE